MTEVKISASLVNELRQVTGAGMMDCKKALTESGGDFEGAIEYLRKKGQKVAANRSDRSASEGAAIAKVSADGKRGVVVLLSCETDFVAKNEEFVKLATQIADLALQNFPATTEELLALTLDGITLEERLTREIGKIGEKIEVSKYETLTAETVIPYIHAGNRIGVLVGLNQPANDAIIAAGRDVAMQTAAMRPVALDETSVPQDIIQKELEIGMELARNEGKPEAMVEKIAQGRLKKFFEESTLLNQRFVKNNDLTIKQFVQSVSKGLEVTGFARAEIG